jgi:aryl-alcohol dehydrogenase-like predicted oxidoreductase
MLDSMRLGRGGIELRPLGVGTNSWNDKSLEGAREALSVSFDAGIKLIDTAEVYSWGGSERAISQLLRESERPCAVATKFAPLPFRLTPDTLSRALDASLDRLGLAQIELYQVHWPYSLLSIERSMERLADEVQAGRVRSVGVSNYGAAQMRRAHAALERRGIPLVSNQVNYSLLHRLPEINGVLEACRELGATLIAYTPLASGALTGKYRPGGRLPTGYRRFLGAFRKLEQAMPVVEELERIGLEHDRSAAQVALNWLARQDAVLPIPGAKHGRQADDNARSIDFEISEDQAARLDAVSLQWRR